MTFKEAYQDDLENAFFDEDEFADRHSIDGEECMVIVTDAKSEDAQKVYGRAKTALNPKESAVSRISHIIYVREKDIKRKLTVNAVINLDGKNYFIHNVVRQEGMYRLGIGIYAV
ncbi:MAG: hypothetical protein J6C19_07960 [Lachnospiraceae bacterium]|nr:hypothetical protein [Lachnospiraceae bacterium]MBO5145452.1 hypothetical protein [Lachnospiraceae bacterium]